MRFVEVPLSILIRLHGVRVRAAGLVTGVELHPLRLFLWLAQAHAHEQARRGEYEQENQHEHGKGVQQIGAREGAMLE